MTLTQATPISPYVPDDLDPDWETIRGLCHGAAGRPGAAGLERP